MSLITPATITPYKLKRPLFDISLPYITIENKKITEKINSVITNEILKELSKLSALSNSNDDITGVYKITLNKKEFISFYSEIMIWSRGAVHPNYYRVTFAINTLTGHFYTLQELFKDRSYIKLISTIVSSMDDFWNFNQIDEKESFYLTEKNLVISFPMGKYTPMVAGPPKYKIPYNKLASLISTKGPIPKIMEG